MDEKTSLPDFHKNVTSKISELEAQLEVNAGEVRKLTDLLAQRRDLQAELRGARAVLLQIQKEVPSLCPEEAEVAKSE